MVSFLRKRDLMTKKQIEEFLQNSLKIDNPELKDAVIKHIVEKGYKEGFHGWEQLRFIKKETDLLWGAIKKCSEREIVHERVDRLIKAFPKPTIK